MARLVNMRPDNEVEPHLAAHLLHIRKQNQTTRSIRERRLTVLRVARFLGHPVADVTRQELVDWQSARVEVLKPAGMHNEIVHTSCYLKWLVLEELRPDDPSVALVRPRHVHQTKPKPMDDREISRALTAANDPDIHVWLGLGSFCGLRCMEMAKLAREDIVSSGAASFLRVIGKGGKERVVPLPESLRNEIEAGPFNPTGHLFNRMDGKPGPPSAMRVSERINDHLKACGVTLRAHSLRHRYGTEMYRNSRDPFRVADLMGHASTDTTRGYVALVDDEGARLAEMVSKLAG